MKKNHGGNIYSIVREYGIPADEIIDFSVNLNPMGTPQAIKKMITESMDGIMHYPDPEYTECRESIAAYHNLPYKYITAGNGATELIFLYCRIIKPARTLVVAPTFSEYSRALEAVGSGINYFRLEEEDEFRPDIDSLNKEISRGYDLVVICNPNNPTGTLFSKKEILSIAEHGARTGCRILLDESFMEFAFNGGNLSTVIENDIPFNIFVIRSLTKILSLPGLRIGYGVSADEELNIELAEQKEPWSINVFAAKAPCYILKDLNYFEETRRVVAEENEFLATNLAKFEWLKTFSSPANYIILKILNHMTSPHLGESLLKKKILIRDASNFMFLDEKFIRIAIKDRESNRMLIDALSEIN